MCKNITVYGEGFGIVGILGVGRCGSKSQVLLGNIPRLQIEHVEHHQPTVWFTYRDFVPTWRDRNRLSTNCLTFTRLQVGWKVSWGHEPPAKTLMCVLKWSCRLHVQCIPQGWDVWWWPVVTSWLLQPLFVKAVMGPYHQSLATLHVAGQMNMIEKNMWVLGFLAPLKHTHMVHIPVVVWRVGSSERPEDLYVVDTDVTWP